MLTSKLRLIIIGETGLHKICIEDRVGNSKYVIVTDCTDHVKQRMVIERNCSQGRRPRPS